MATTPYLTVARLRNALLSAGGAGARTAAELDEPTLDRIIAENESEVVGRLHKFTLPDPAVPDLVPDLLLFIITSFTAYGATLEYFGSQPLEERDPINLRYQRALKLLGDIAAGRLEVDGITTGPGESGGDDAEIFQGMPHVGIADSFRPGVYDTIDLQGGPYVGGPW